MNIYTSLSQLVGHTPLPEPDRYLSTALFKED